MNSGMRYSLTDLMSRMRDRVAGGHADRQARRLYAIVVEQARQTAFYAAGGVPDTMEGRFDMIVLHLCLVLRRLRGEDGALMRAGQAVFNAFCADMDGNLREMGVGDLAVPKRMKKFGEAFYGRAAAYDEALNAQGDAALRAALVRNVFGDSDAADHADVLARYVRKVDRQLAVLPRETLAASKWHFPVPELSADLSLMTGGVHGH